MSSPTAGSPGKPNRLASEKSPYLLQHANNPVDWYPWGPEAFERARKEDRVIFLSIGYATCHWCHVMERESFEDSETAELMNQNFVAIKVDREERPDVDQIYMKALQASGQHGGWPLNMFLTPDLKPIAGGTYFPPEPAYGRPSFRQVLESIQSVWKSERHRIDASVQSLTEYLEKSASTESATKPLPGREALNTAVEHYASIFDKLQGGFLSNGPNKFPPSMAILFLNERWRKTADPRLLEMSSVTLEHMKRGGIYDQLGGGLSRYSTDHDWLVPHFEKMLYDNALFLAALADTYQITGRPEFRTWAYDVISYLKTYMTSPEGAFYSAEDADSEGEEGKFYVWSMAELENILSNASISLEDRKRLYDFWGVSSRGNFEGKNILHERTGRKEFLSGSGKTEEEWDSFLTRAREILLDERNRRVRPLRDEKILLNWNALTIRALSRCSRIFEDATIQEMAQKAAVFIENKMKDSDGSMLRRYCDGEAKYRSTLEDLSLYGLACLELYRTSFDPDWLDRSVELADTILNEFSAPEGAFYDAAASPDLIIRSMDAYDGVEPSGNSASAPLFLQLSSYGYRPIEYRRAAEGIYRFFSESISTHGLAYPFLLTHLEALLDPGIEAAIVPGRDEIWKDGLYFLRKNLSADLTVAVKSGKKNDPPLLEGRSDLDGSTAFYICRNLACERPVKTMQELKALTSRA